MTRVPGGITVAHRSLRFHVGAINKRLPLSLNTFEAMQTCAMWAGALSSAVT